MLITSRGTGRWIIPKGWPVDGLAPHEAAAREAVEEGGLVGRIGAHPIGTYRYEKQEIEADCEVAVFALEVVGQLLQWPEQHERRKGWFALQEAAEAVQEPELADVIRNLSAIIGTTS